MTVTFFNSAYAGVPPWDIGRPQVEFVGLAQGGEFRGDVLDVGCGTGENALHLASFGHAVWGIDAAPPAVEKARRKARERGFKATFLVWDALDLAALGRTFDTVVDCGLFHVFSDEDRLHYVESLAAVLQPGGRLHMLCFSDREPGVLGPRRVSEAEIRAAFREGWQIDVIRPARFETNTHPDGAHAWLASLTKA